MKLMLGIKLSLFMSLREVKNESKKSEIFGCGFVIFIRLHNSRTGLFNNA